MDRRQAYECDVLSTFADLARGGWTPELSDADRDREYRAQQTFFTALDAFRTDVQSAAALTSLRKDALTELLASLDDAAPDATAWDEAIADARKGY